MEKFSGKGFGKFILFGEHAVVYGKPAIGCHIDRGTRVTLRRKSRKDENGFHALDEKGVEAFELAARHAGLNLEEWICDVHSHLPSGQGLGSSAAFSVAMSIAILKATQGNYTVDDVTRLAGIMEKVFHGNPSGIDVTLASGSGPILYYKGGPIQPLKPKKALHFLILLSGTSPATKSMVEMVREKLEREPVTNKILDEIGNLTLKAINAIETGSIEEIAGLMNQNHLLLRDLGVSNSILESIRNRAIKAGSPGVKLTGGGGGGALICIAKSREHAIKIISTLGMEKSSMVVKVKVKDGGKNHDGENEK